MNRRFTLICLSLGVFSIPYFRWVWPILFTAVDPGGIDSIYYNAANVVSLILASALSFSVLVTPGILVKIHRRSDEWMWVPLVGPAFLGLTGLGYWLAPAPLALVLLPALLGGLILVQLCWVLARTIWPERINLTLVSVMVAAIALGVAKSSYSHGPKGELYANSISHTLEPGLRPDSRIGYHVVQMIAHHWSPMERAADRLFAPYHFSSRGPLAGFIVAPLSILAAIDVPVDPPDQSYRTFDPEGFMAFRIAMVVLTVLMTFVPFYCVLRLLSGNYFAVAACANLALMPFTLHEIFFTWPKLSAAGLAIGTFYLLMSGRSFFVGIASAGAYLFHPLALLGLPFSYLAFVCFDKRTGNAQKIAVLLKAAIPFGLIVLGWFALGGFVNHQSGFLNYISTARGESALSVANWMSARWESLLATFLPLYFYHLHGETLLAENIYGFATPEICKIFFGYATTFPMGVGLVAFAILLFRGPILFFRFWRSALLVVGLQLFVFVIFWGSKDIGLMPEGLHTWFLSTVAFFLWAAYHANAQSNDNRTLALLSSRSWQTARGVELFLATYLASFATGRVLGPPTLSDSLAVLVSIAAIWRIVRLARLTRLGVAGVVPISEICAIVR